MATQVGSQFHKIDFHVHTTHSSDYKDKNATPKDIVNAAIAAGLSAIVVTDHNTAAGIDPMRLAASGTPLVIFPGIEITAQGGHVLAVFEPETPIAILNEVLIKCDIPLDRWGDENAIGPEFTKVIEVITKHGLAIAAHADGPKGFLTTTTQGQAHIRIYMSPHLSAMELVSLERLDDYVNGTISGYERPMPVVQGSDAHSLGQIGVRATYLKLQHQTLAGLRQAFGEPQLRIRFGEEWQSKPYSCIESMEVSQGFLAGQVLHFNPGLNCLVGGAGSGKSTVVEFIRFALDQVSSIEAMADDCVGKLRDMAQLGASITVVIALDSGERLKITRVFDDDENPTSVVRLSDGQVVPGIDVRKLASIHAYSQGEAIAISRNPLAQLELIDKHIDLASSLDDVKRLYGELEGQISGIATLEAKVREGDNCDRNLRTVREQIRGQMDELANITKAQKDPVVTSHPFWQTENAIFADLIKTALPNLIRDASEKLDDIDLRPLVIQASPGQMPNQDLLDECHKLLGEIELAKQKAKTALIRAITNAQTGVTAKGRLWQQRNSVHQAEYLKRHTAKGQERALAISQALENLKKEEHKYLFQQQAIAAAKRTLTTLLQKRVNLLKELDDTKARILALRDRKARQIVKRIGERISLKVVPDGNRTRYEDTLSELMRGSYAQRDTIRRVCEMVHPIELVRLLRAGDTGALDTITSIGDRWATALLNQSRANPEFLYELESVPVEDKLEIGFKIEKGQYRSLEKLSTGQKATVIVLLSMVEGTQPILFDQPEDALYTPFIYTDVVKTLKAEKDQRQFILATHNANISIAADMDLGIVLESSATQAGIRSMGALDDGATQELMVLHLEGGPEAFLARQRKLGLG